MHCKLLFSLVSIEKGKDLLPPPSSQWNLTLVTSDCGLGFSASHAVPRTPIQCVNKLCLRRISPQAALLRSHSWKHITRQPQDGTTVSVKCCRWNKWAMDDCLSHFFFFNWGIIFVSAVGFSLLSVWILFPLGKGIKKKKKIYNRTCVTWTGE